MLKTTSPFEETSSPKEKLGGIGAPLEKQIPLEDSAVSKDEFANLVILIHFGFSERFVH